MSVYTVIALIVVALLISAITSYVAYQKREKIAEGMRRASEYARKASLRVRASLSGRPQNEPQADPNEKIKPVNQF